MANLKADLLQELRTQKYYAELELLRLAQDPTMRYRNKIDELDDLLADIALINSKIGLAEGYFQDAPVEQPQAVPNLPQEEVPQAPVDLPKEEVVQQVVEKPVVTQPHAGQSHAE